MLVTITTMQAGKPTNSYFPHSVTMLVHEYLEKICNPTLYLVTVYTVAQGTKI